MYIEARPHWHAMETVSHITVFKTMHLWMRSHAFENAYTRLLRLYRRQRRPRFCCIDSSYVKNIYGRDCTYRNPTDRGRRATKLSVIVDDISIRSRPLFALGYKLETSIFNKFLNMVCTTCLKCDEKNNYETHPNPRRGASIKLDQSNVRMVLITSSEYVDARSNA